jgi:hypothetical protein
VKRIYCAVADRRGLRLWDGLVPGTCDRDALEALLRGDGWIEALPGGLLEGELYRLHAGACSATAHGDELDRVAAVAKGHDGVLDDEADKCLKKLVESIKQPPKPPPIPGDVELRRRVLELLYAARVWPVNLGASYADGTIDVEGEFRDNIPGLTVYSWSQDMGSGDIISTRVGLTP